MQRLLTGGFPKKWLKNNNYLNILVKYGFCGFSGYADSKFDNSNNKCYFAFIFNNKKLEENSMQSNSQLVQFYLGQGPDNRGRMIDEILAWKDEQIENVHDYIQWLFPLKETSAFNSSAPVLSEADIATFRNNTKVNQKLLLSLAKLIDFYGFMATWESGTYQIVKSKDFQQKSRNWLTRNNHNFLRITRILKSLVLLGSEKHSRILLVALEEVYKDNSKIIGQETLNYWKDALNVNTSA